MPAVNPGEVWMTDFEMAAKVRPALILTGEPAADEHESHNTAFSAANRSVCCQWAI
jgi:hypothetical protein